MKIIFAIIPALSLFAPFICSGMVWREAADFSNDHLAPTPLGSIEFGMNKITGSIIDRGVSDSDSFVLFNPSDFLIESINVTITSSVNPIYPPFDPTNPLGGRLPGVILVQPNSGGSIPSGDGNYLLSSDYDESGDLFLADSSELTFSIFYDSRPELLAPGGFEYEISLLAAVREPWYKNASNLADGWRYFDWFKGFKPEGLNWMFHGRHGWLYALADNTTNIFLWDPALGRWMFTNATVYPWMYAYGDDGGWVFFFESGRPGSRFFGRSDNGAVVSEGDLSLNP